MKQLIEDTTTVIGVLLTEGSRMVLTLISILMAVSVALGVLSVVHGKPNVFKLAVYVAGLTLFVAGHQMSKILY